jgi:hypothetical protein
MKTGRFFLVVTTCLVVMRVISHADDRQRALAGVGLRPGKSANDQSLHVPRSISVPVVKPSPTTPRNHALASIGGPAKGSRSTAMINGTNMKHKP